MTLLADVVLSAAKLEDHDLLVSILLDDRSAHRGASHGRHTHVRFVVVAHKQHVVKREFTSAVAVDLFDLNDVAFFYSILPVRITAYMTQASSEGTGR